MSSYTVFQTNGKEQVHKLPEGVKILSLDVIQKHIGGYFEIVDIPKHPNKLALVDEEGMLKKLPFNARPSMITGRELVGPVIICPSSMMDDESSESESENEAKEVSPVKKRKKSNNEKKENIEDKLSALEQQVKLLTDNHLALQLAMAQFRENETKLIKSVELLTQIVNKKLNE